MTFEDTYGDGWDGVTFLLVGSNGATFSGTLADGKYETHTLCDLGATCFNAYMTGNSDYPSEIGWSVVDDAGEVDVDGDIYATEAGEEQSIFLLPIPRHRMSLCAAVDCGHGYSASPFLPLAFHPPTHAVAPAQVCTDGATPPSSSPTLSHEPTITRPTYTVGTYSELMAAKVKLKCATRARTHV